MATGAVPVRIRTATHFSSENSHRETLHRGRTFRPPWAFVEFTAALRYEPCIQFINVSQRTLHIYFIDGCRRIKIERNNLLCEQAPTEVFRSIFAWLVTFKLRMILCQKLFCVSNAVSVQRKLFSIAHDDFTESQLLHVSAVQDELNGRGKEGGMIFYLGE